MNYLPKHSKTLINRSVSKAEWKKNQLAGNSKLLTCAIKNFSFFCVCNYICENLSENENATYIYQRTECQSK